MATRLLGLVESFVKPVVTVARTKRGSVWKMKEVGSTWRLLYSSFLGKRQDIHVYTYIYVYIIYVYKYVAPHPRRSTKFRH